MKRALLWLILSLVGTGSLVWFMVFDALPASLVDRRWSLQAIQTGDNSTSWTWDQPDSFYLEFSLPGKVTGEASCNSLNGNLHTIRFTHRLWGQLVFMTAMNCIPSPVDMNTREAQFQQGINTATRFELQQGQLRIYFGDADHVMLFREARR